MVYSIWDAGAPSASAANMVTKARKRTGSLTRGIRALLPAAVLTSLALAGCGSAQLLTGLALAPIEDLPAVDLVHATDDLGQRSRLRFLVFGDAGTGRANQRLVARAMLATCDARGGCDFALVTGDLIYPAGARSESDEAFDRKFEAVYEDFGSFAFWLVTGNHDWYRKGSVAEEIRYSLHSARWRLPRVDYAVPGLPEWLTIYGLDTTLLESGADRSQIDRARESLCSATGWRLLFGHHGVYSVGKHADRHGRIAGIAEHVEPLIEACSVHFYLAGHDHLQAHFSAPGYEQIIQGAGGRFLHGPRDRALPEGVRLRAAESRFGFALVEATATDLEVRFYAAEKAGAHEFRCRRYTLARFGRGVDRGEACAIDDQTELLKGPDHDLR